MSSEADSHVLIIGAGITGLVLAQALRERNATNPSLKPITFSIYERDAHPMSRGAGWGITLHWALGQFKALLPKHLVERLNEAFVDKDATEQGNLGSFRFFNLQTGETDFISPPSDDPRHRFAREKLRTLLMDGLDIEWSKTLVDIQYPRSGEVVAQFSDGSTAKETSSLERMALALKCAASCVLPTTQTMSYPFDSWGYFFQCADPATDTFMFFGFLHAPTSKEQEAANGTLPVTSQILTSWPYRPGFNGNAEPSEVPGGNAERIAWMKKITAGWVEPFKSIVQDIPENAEAKPISLEDWLPKKDAWDNHGGTVTMIGDAAHAMTMYRGEAANHGVADVRVFLEQFLPENHQDTSSQPSLKEKIDAYELEMVERTRPAVLRSRQACLHAHDYASVTAESPLIAKRSIVVDNDA